MRYAVGLGLILGGAAVVWIAATPGTSGAG